MEILEFKFPSMGSWETLVSNPDVFADTDVSPLAAGAGKSVLWYVVL